MKHSLIVAAVAGLLGTLVAQAQLTEFDIQNLRKRGQIEGWTFTVGESEATHRPLSELCGTIVPPVIPPSSRPGDGLYRGPRRELPYRFDWREHGGLPTIKNQGQCGSCWAFGTMGPFECNYMLRTGEEEDFSEQWLVSCNQEGWGCSGGWVAHDYHLCDGKKDPCGGGGAVYERDFPYEAKDLPCQCPYDHPTCLYAWDYVNPGFYYPNVDEVKQAILEYGPVSALVYVGSAFQAYKSGVFNACGTGELNHLITLVGWDDTLGENGVWILRNSWAPSWGMGGYMLIQYDCACVGYLTSWVDYRPEDCNRNGIPDQQEPGWADCNNNGLMDSCEVGGTADCNLNGTPDLCDLYSGGSADCNGNLVPDECDIGGGFSTDCNANGVPDECEPGHNQDCNQNGIPDLCDIYAGTSTDCNENAVPDECETQWNLDCNNNGIKDICDIASGYSQDDDANWIPDECQTVRKVPSVEYPTIQSAIDAANLGDTVLVADGVYSGTGNCNIDLRSKTILLVRSENGPENCIVDAGGNAMGFMAKSTETAATQIVGFTVRRATSGIYCFKSAPTIEHCIITGCTNAGVFCGKQSTATVRNCLIAGNRASGVNISGCSPRIINCTIVGNRATVSGGGVGVGSFGGIPNPIVRNCVIWGNEAPKGAQVAVGPSSTMVIDYSMVQGGQEGIDLGLYASVAWGAGNDDKDPLVYDLGHWDDNGTPGNTADDLWVMGDYHLQVDSPCINGGHPKADYTRQVDCDGQPRVLDGHADIGIDEFVLYGDMNCDGAVDANDVNAFVWAIVGPSYYAANYPDCHHFRADCNRDGLVDFGDINAFTELVCGTGK